MMDQNNLFPKEYGGMGGDTMTFGKPSIVSPQMLLALLER